METATTRPCLACGKPVKGRIDKKFCDDYCRNVYNNQAKLDESTVVRQIISTLKKNRRILADFLGDKGITKVAKTKLLHAGFQFSYHTHQYVNQKGDIYFFCFEYGYLPLESDWYLLVKRKEEKTKE